MMQVSDRLVHIFPNKKMDVSHVQFASQYVIDTLLRALAGLRMAEIEGFVQDSQDLPMFGVTRGRFLEFVAWRKFKIGGEFEARNLETGKAGLPLPS